MSHVKNSIAACVSAGMILMGTPSISAAAMIGTETLASQSLRADTEARVQTLLSRDDVQTKLVAWGVDVEKAKSRANAMSDAELQRVAYALDQQPAGGDIIVLIGVIFVVLLILELVGVTNVFTSF
ncbi:MAG: PA2779 family protein [Stagnimonas sp.]|nr:PA2779 family protein [Stagnimonas sp.]